MIGARNTDGQLPAELQELRGRVAALGAEVAQYRRTESLLRHQNELLTALIDSLPDPIYLKDVAGRFVLANQAAALGLGCSSPEELTGRTDADLHAEAQAAVKLAEEQEMLRRGQGLTSVEVPSRTPSGETRWLVDTRVPVRDRSGAIIGIGGCWRDITERRLAEDDVKVNLALQRVRNEVLRMQGEDDWMAVVKVFDDELRQVVAVHECGINVANPRGDRVRVYGVEGSIDQPIGITWEALVAATSATGRSAYRPRRSHTLFPPGMPAEINSVADAPFARGTVGINSLVEDAFSARDLAVLEQFATVMSEAHQRLEDLSQLEALRRQAEEAAQRALRRERAMGRIRDQILRMQHLSEAAAELERGWADELRAIGIPVNHVSLQWPADRAGYFVFGRSLLRQGEPDAQAYPLSTAPWVAQAWETGVPVVVTQGHPEADWMAREGIQSLVEVPLPGLGSLGVNSLVRDAFGAEAIHVLQEFAGLVATATKRLQDQEALHHSEEKYRRLFETAQTGMFRTRLDGSEILDVNGRFLEITGYGREELLGGPALGLWADPRQHAEMVRQLESSGSVTDLECRLVNKHGEVRLCLISARLQVEQAVMEGSVSDITDRRQAEEMQRWEHRMRASDHAIRLAVAAMNEPQDLQRVLAEISSQLTQLGVVHHDTCSLQVVNAEATSFISVTVPRGEIPDWNRLWDYWQCRVQDGHLSFTYPRDEDLTEADLRERRTVIAVWRDQTFRYEPCMPPGPGAIAPGTSVVDVAFSHGTLAANCARPNAFSPADISLLQRFARMVSEGFRRFLDIAQRHRAEQELIRAHRLRAMGELSMGLSHNLNNILTGVVLPAQMLREMRLAPEAGELVDQIVAAGLRATQLVSRLHESVRGVPQQTLEAVDVNRVVMEAVRMTRPRWKDEPEAHGAPIAVETRLGEVPPIQGTTSGLHDALVNLIFNAVAAMPDGGAITIETQRAAAGVELICRDTGIGMNEETRRRVFEPFFTTRRDVGSGLGLSMADAAVTAWGGRISVESAPRAGTTFTILLPLWTGSQSQPGGAPPTSGPSRPARLLLVEDDEATSRVVSHLLSGQHQVDVVADGPAALAQLVPGRYDAALIDLGLPGMPGDRVRQEIAQVDAAVVGVLITGWVLEAGDPRMRGFELALQKPFADAAALHEAVAQAVRLHDARARRQNEAARGDSFGQAS